jgi:dipeptidase
MIKDIRAERDRFESSAYGGQQELEARALALWNNGDHHKGARQMLTKHREQNAAAVMSAWW